MVILHKGLKQGFIARVEQIKAVVLVKLFLNKVLDDELQLFNLGLGLEQPVPDSVLVHRNLAGIDNYFNK